MEAIGVKIMARTSKNYRLRALCLLGVSMPLIALAGCTEHGRLGWHERYGLVDHLDDPFEDNRLRSDKIHLSTGDAVAHNKAVQTINPWPSYAKNQRINMDGDRARIAIERYKANKVVEPEGLATTEVVTETGS